VHGDMIGLIAFDLVLRIVLARMMDIALVVHVPRVHPYDVTGDPASFGIPGYMVADFECLRHEVMLFHLFDRRCRDGVRKSAEKASFLCLANRNSRTVKRRFSWRNSISL
jgi:hypothetical protein